MSSRAERLHRLAHPGAEVETAKGVAAAGSVMVLSARSSVPLDRVPEALGDAPWWFQIYVMRDPSLAWEVVQRAAVAGARALLTGDTPYVGIKARPSEFVSVAAFQLANLATLGC